MNVLANKSYKLTKAVYKAVNEAVTNPDQYVASHRPQQQPQYPHQYQQQAPAPYHGPQGLSYYSSLNATPGFAPQAPQIGYGQPNHGPVPPLPPRPTTANPYQSAAQPMNQQPMQQNKQWSGVVGQSSALPSPHPQNQAYFPPPQPSTFASPTGSQSPSQSPVSRPQSIPTPGNDFTPPPQGYPSPIGHPIPFPGPSAQPGSPPPLSPPPLSHANSYPTPASTPGQSNFQLPPGQYSTQAVQNSPNTQHSGYEGAAFVAELPADVPGAAVELPAELPADLPLSSAASKVSAENSSHSAHLSTDAKPGQAQSQAFTGRAPSGSISHMRSNPPVIPSSVLTSTEQLQEPKPMHPTVSSGSMANHIPTMAPSSPPLSAADPSVGYKPGTYSQLAPHFNNQYPVSPNSVSPPPSETQNWQHPYGMQPTYSQQPQQPQSAWMSSLAQKLRHSSLNETKAPPNMHFQNPQPGPADQKLLQAQPPQANHGQLFVHSQPVPQNENAPGFHPNGPPPPYVP